MSKLSDDLRALSAEAYLYLYPLVIMDISRRQQTNVAAGERMGFGPPNQFQHVPQFPPAEVRAVVRPNFDTLYSLAWLDLSDGPVLVHVPDSDDRYYLLPMLDMWTDVFANPGKRTTGTGAQDYLVTFGNYDGEVPPGATAVVSPTPYVWVIGRTQTNGPGDYPAVNAFQHGMSIRPLAGGREHVIDPTVDTTTEPLRLVSAMSASEFFTHATTCLKVNRPHLTDFSVLARIADLGIIPGNDFDPNRFDADQMADLDAGIDDARQAMLDRMATAGMQANGWTTNVDTMGVYGNNYLQRGYIALIGLGANPAEDATYPLLLADADGDPLSGERDYVMHFDADGLPPCDAFWSVTMYDGEGYQVTNELNRFAIGDRDPLRYNEDGSLDLYIQHANPGIDSEANWLPSPIGSLGITMRIYAPRPDALNGNWAPPPVRKT